MMQLKNTVRTIQKVQFKTVWFQRGLQEEAIATSQCGNEAVIITEMLTVIALS